MKKKRLCYLIFCTLVGMACFSCGGKDAAQKRTGESSETIQDENKSENMTKEDFMREAIALSCSSVEHGGGPFGAVIVRDGKIIARGSNSVTLLNDPTAHAEVSAIRAACSAEKNFKLEGCEL